MLNKIVKKLLEEVSPPALWFMGGVVALCVFSLVC